MKEDNTGVKKPITGGRLFKCNERTPSQKSETMLKRDRL